MKELLKSIILEAIRRASEQGKLPPIDPPPSITLEQPPDERWGDYATNVAMPLAQEVGLPPRQVAEEIAGGIRGGGVIKRVEVAGPGFINLTLEDRVWFGALKEANLRGEAYGRRELGKGKRVLIEFLSANPTGPLHIGHGRIAALGDILANVLEAAGYEVEREYYINDVGAQMEALGRSVYARYMELWGREVPFPEDGYQGEYIREIAARIKEERGERYLQVPDEEAQEEIRERAKEIILEGIKEDLEVFRVRFDHWVREASLYEEGLLQEALDALKEKGLLYEADGALWFKSTLFGDEKDRVVVRANGTTTYFASDISYHREKFRRGYDLLVDIWGADHHGYVPRVRAALRALGLEEERLKVLLVQLVNLMRGGKKVSMSTRAGEFTTLREVIEEVGVDACRYFFMLRRADSPVDFDLELAKRQSAENPVYYVQYAHARISSIFRKAAERGVALPEGEVDLGPLVLPEERGLAKRVGLFPDLIEEMALSFEPHRLIPYLQDMVSLFHSYYNKHRVLTEDEGLTAARLYLVKAIRIVVRNALSLLGIEAPEEM